MGHEDRYANKVLLTRIFIPAATWIISLFLIIFSMIELNRGIVFYVSDIVFICATSYWIIFMKNNVRMK